MAGCNDDHAGGAHLRRRQPKVIIRQNARNGSSRNAALTIIEESAGKKDGWEKTSGKIERAVTLVML
jgi:hypothetical protein